MVFMLSSILDIGLKREKLHASNMLYWVVHPSLIIRVKKDVYYKYFSEWVANVLLIT